MKKILQNERLESCSLIWMQLGFKAQVETSKTTIQKVMGILQYHKYLTYQRNW